MSEHPGNAEEAPVGDSEPGGTEGHPATQGAATPPDVRDVVGRRGYDESEDETATEDEEH
jgi:hypothetical protein